MWWFHLFNFNTALCWFLETERCGWMLASMFHDSENGAVSKVTLCLSCGSKTMSKACPFWKEVWKLSPSVGTLVIWYFLEKVSYVGAISYKKLPRQISILLKLISLLSPNHMPIWWTKSIKHHFTYPVVLSLLRTRLLVLITICYMVIAGEKESPFCLSPQSESILQVVGLCCSKCVEFHQGWSVIKES